MKKISLKKTCFGIAAVGSFTGVIGIVITVILLFFVCQFSLQILDEVTASWDTQPTGTGFFESGGGWDYRRIALIEPYQAINSNRQTWRINTKTDSIEFQISIVVTKLDVVNNRFIITYAPDAPLGGKRVNELWFVIIPDENIEKGFSNEEEFLAYLAEKNISTPNLRDIDELYEELRRKGYLEWFPDEYKEK
jgi:hypothetical protein